MSLVASVVTKKPSARKLISQIFDLFDVKQKTAVRQLGADKINHKTIRKGNSLWSTIQNI